MLFSIPFDCSYYDTIILMHGGFGQPKGLRRLTDGGTLFQHVLRHGQAAAGDGFIHAFNPFKFCKAYEGEVFIMR